MKQFFLAIGAVSLMAACNNAPDADKAQTGDKAEAAAVTGATYTVDTLMSKVNWIGTKVDGQHQGTFNITSGTVSAESGVITGGSFNINIASILVTDLTEETGKGKLEGHLASADFFNVETYPTAHFEITSVEPYDSTKIKSLLAGATNLISGNLTLKDSTKNVTFPAVISIDDATINATADFNIDRTLWGMNYKGPNNPADWYISKDVNLKLSLKAAK